MKELAPPEGNLDTQSQSTYSKTYENHRKP